jgi:hypothetical protein
MADGATNMDVRKLERGSAAGSEMQISPRRASWLSAHCILASRASCSSMNLSRSLVAAPPFVMAFFIICWATISAWDVLTVFPQR